MHSKNTPSVVVFDLGKVLLDFDYTIAARKLAPRCRASIDEARIFIDQSPLLHRYELGQVTTREFYSEVAKFTGFGGTSEEFADCFGDIFNPIPEMLELHDALRKNGIPTYIFSNTNDLAILHVRQRYPFFAGFNGYVFSHEHGAMKPDPRLYEVVERTTGRSGGEIAYLDDRPENVEAGGARGWHAILHETPEKSRAAIARLGLLNGNSGQVRTNTNRHA